ncbi:MAG: competence/damage-inducible protein A [Candidatus Riflebacteria bacterium]|nr:competence/damage-inducible protein A [Candidatus Riflebacteria bacterium]
MKQPIAEIVSVGTELLLGELVDTNSAWLAGDLRDRGVFVYFKTVVGDNRQRLRDTVARALDRSDLVIVGGGLGPTDDDLTREAIADAVGETPQVDPTLLARLEALFAARQREMPAINRKQAWLIPSAEPLDNPVGTAFGWLVRTRGKLVVAMPGPPHEMKRMWLDQALPRLALGPAGFWHTTIHTLGIGEGSVGELLAAFTGQANPSVATYARRHGVDVRVAASAPTPEAAAGLARPVLAEVERVLAPYIWGRDAETIAQVIGRLLTDRGQTVACAESLTGGLVADTLTDTPGASGWFRGGMVTYTPEAKRLLGVRAATIDKNGVVSEPVARAMAAAARRKFGADWGLATTGVAGPAALEGQPVGRTFLAVTGPAGTTVAAPPTWLGERRQIKERTVNGLLMLFFRLLRGEPTP